jgi:hypothetical protein
MKPSTDVDDCIAVCNSLLRGELSAIETYAKTITKFAQEPQIPSLEAIRDEHVNATLLLRENVRSMGGIPRSESGAWGVFAKGVQNAANLFGENSAFQSLQAGEEHGRKEYLDALENEEVLPECKALIRDELLPRTDRHLAVLKSLKKSL